MADDGNRRVSISKPEQRRRQSRIGIDDFGELVRSDTSQSHDFFYDAVFSEMYKIYYPNLSISLILFHSLFLSHSHSLSCTLTQKSIFTILNFDYRISQETVFDACVKGIVESVLHGYNGSIIASGQTGKLNILKQS